MTQAAPLGSLSTTSDPHHTTQHRGLFLVFEGGDGAGKTTQSALLSQWLKTLGHSVLRTREPGGTPLGTALRELLLHGEHVQPRAEALLYAADRAQHIDEIVRPALTRGEIIVQDRYIYSSLAYQGAGRVLTVSDIRSISEWATENLWPDLTIVLDISPEAAAARRNTRGEDDDRIEAAGSEFHRQVREEFLALAAAEPQRTLVVDATQPVDIQQQQIRDAVLRLLSA